MSQAATKPRFSWATPGPWFYVALVCNVFLIAAILQNLWLPHVRGWLGWESAPAAASVDKHSEKEPAGDAHAGHDHSHAGHDEGNSIELSLQARKNLGIEGKDGVVKVELKPFTRTLSLPGIVAERLGRSVVQVPAPLTGIITKIYPTQGEAVVPGQKLFDIRLTHEELVQSQADLLKTVEELDVIAREVARIEEITKDGALARKQLLERQYEQQKQEAALRSQSQALILHGLTTGQVDAIVKKRTLLQSLTVEAPGPTDRMAAADEPRFFQVQDLKVAQGQHVTAGETLAVLVDHSELFIEGNAFERDIAEINRASAADQPLTALMEIEGKEPQIVKDLRLLYVDSQVDPESRTLHFYVTLPNMVEQNKQNGDRRYVSWRYRPGQRTQLLVPVETWKDRIVLPVDAIVEEGAETYVFTPNGDHFDRRAVHVEYKDQTSVVVANDGVLFPGDSVVKLAAKQLQLALKNKSSGPADPHAGHNH